MLADSRVSPVSFLNANPKIAMRLFVTVLNSLRTMCRENRRFWYSLMSTTDCQ
jgi:hypothetical protein